MQLYTSLVRLKQAMQNGATPPMTPIPESVHHIIDPAFTIGLGAITEDPVKGLRCPVRGCGTWHHVLSHHITSSHRSLGVDGVRRALSLPATMRLVSMAHSTRLRAAAASRPQSDRQRAAFRPGSRKGTVRRSASGTVGQRNMRDRCQAQLAHRLIDLRNTLGRTPTQAEAISAWGGHSVVREIEKVYGTWNNALVQCGMTVRRKVDLTVADALEGLRAYHSVHGVLPSIRQAAAPTRTPLVMSHNTIKKLLGEPTWYDCMRKAARSLGIRDGRYGLTPFADEVAA
jgi:hypothetical protein